MVPYLTLKSVPKGTPQALPSALSCEIGVAASRSLTSSRSSMPPNLPDSVGHVNRLRYTVTHTILGMGDQKQLKLSVLLSANVKSQMAKRSLGVSADALRSETGVGQGTAVSLLSGESDARLSTVEKLAKKWRMTPWQLLLPNIETADEFAVTIPRLANAAGMGKGVALLDSDSVVERITVTKPWLQAHVPSSVRPENLRIITALGDSMEPTLKNGDMVLVDTAPHKLDLDGVYVLMDPESSQLWIKRVSRIKRDGKIIAVVTSDNPTTPPFGDPEGMTVVGKVVRALIVKEL